MIRVFLLLLLLPLLLLMEFIWLPLFKFPIFPLLAFNIYEKGKGFRSLFLIVMTGIGIDLWSGSFLGGTTIAFVVSLAIYKAIKKILPVSFALSQWISLLLFYFVYLLIFKFITDYTNSGEILVLSYQAFVRTASYSFILLVLSMVISFVDTVLISRASQNIRL